MKYSYRRIFLLIALLTTGVVFAQLPMTRTTFTGSFSSINSGASNGGTLSTAVGDDVTQDNLPIGFTFNYLGTNYTTMGVSTNGWASFVGSLGGVSQAGNTNLFSTSGPNLSIGPWWDDLTSDSIVYKTTGIPGSQVFTIQWYSKSYYTTSTQKISFQLKLFEGTNVIEFQYSPVLAGTGYPTSESASIGIEGATGGNGNYLDAVTGSAFVGHGYMYATTKWPTRFYRFTPGVPTALAGGTYNVGAGQTYPTIDEAIAELNHRGITGPVTLALTQSLYDITPANGDNIFPVFVGPVVGSSATNTITIAPLSGVSAISYDGAVAGSGANASTTSAFGTSSEPIIGLVGSNYVSISNLSLTCTNTGVVDRGIAMINQSAVLGTSFCSVKNVTVSLNRGNTSSIGFETRTATAPTITGGANSNNSFIDVNVTNVYAGILLSGTTAFPDLNNSITTSSALLYNQIGASTANDIGNGSSTTYGIQAAAQSGVIIRNNQVQNVSVTGAVVCDGIFLNGLQGTSSVSNNKVMNIKNLSTTATSALSGIKANIQTIGTHELRVYNNFISGITSAYTGAASSTRQIKGIYVQSAGGGANTQTINVDFNNISIDGSSSPNISSTCYEIGTSSGPIINTRNNVFANFTASQTAPAQHINWFSTSATLVGNTGSISNYNDLFILNATQGNVGFGNTTPYPTLVNWQTGTSQDANSQSCNPTYSNNVTDLHVGAACLDGTGNMTNITWVTTDIDNTTRSSPPDIGADEFILPSCTTVSGGTVTPGSYTICSNQAVTLNTTGSTIGTGIVYAWQTSSTPGGPYTNVSAGSGSATTSYNTGTLSPGTYYFIQQITCTTSAATAASNEVTVTVNPVPAVSVSPVTTTICLPGGSAVALTGAGATTYSWLPVAGLSSTTGISVNASPSVTTVYTVTGSSSGCNGTATTTITVSEVPSIFISATPTAVCTGGTSNLLANGGLTNSYSITSIPYNAILTPTSGVTTLCNNGTASVPLSSGNLDDGGWSNQTIPFNFQFFGSTYSSFAVSTNGFIFLGTGNPGTYSGYSTSFPSATPAKPSIGVMYSDLDFDGVGSNSSIKYFTSGTTPNQKLVVSWTGQFFNNTGTLTTQAIIYESSNIIEVHTFTSTGTNASVEGIQNSTGTTAYVVPGRNAVTWAVSTPDAYRWSPNGGTVSYNWSPSTFLSANNISNPVASNMTSSTSYTVVVNATNGCSNTAVQNITVNSLPVVSITSPTVACSGSSISLTASGANTYSWSTGSTLTTITDAPTNPTSYTVTGTNTVTGCSNSTVQAVAINALPSVTISGVSPICAGSSASLTATGANTYTWNTNATSAGISVSPSVTSTYSVTGEDANGCMNTAMQTVTVNSLPVITITGTTAVCDGMSANLTGNGATTYSWNTGATTAVIAVTPSVNTSYTVTGTDLNNCSDTASFMLTVNPNPTITAVSGVICPGASFTLAPTGASTYTYLPNGPVVSPSSTTTYSISGTDALGCMSQTAATAVVTVTNNLSVTINGNTTVCFGQPASLTAGGASTYSWNTGASTNTIAPTPTINTTYSVTGSSGTCSNTAVVTITVNALPSVSLSASSTTACTNGSTIALTGSPSGGVYGGSNVSGNIFTPPAASGTFTPSYSYTDAITSCSNNTNTSIIVSVCTDISKNTQALTGLQVYPNPNLGEFTIELNNGAGKKVELSDLTGRIILTEVTNNDKMNINISNLANGVYFVKVQSNNSVEIVRIIKQ